ncbi:hypothetical protein GAY29_27425 [Azospirillum brasilense]|uniref:hypothetical protein n=1 Tax=Azospirillum brasilense TaxID=192 RepID=UPI00190AFAFD|nr:hypothetical protein [Azospirillum brasilense]MBK3736751.1 hypothetical protein [Azospirillum brasilense]
MMRTLIAATALLPVLLAGTGCAPLGGDRPGAILEKLADGDYDVGIRYPAKRARYVMIVEEDEDGFVVTNRPAAGREVDTVPAPASTPVVAQPQRNDRALAPCAEATGNWYRHTPAGYVCVGQSAPGGGG